MESIQKNLKVCEICKIYATSLCCECSCYFCDSCYKFIHEKEANNQHKKEKIDYFVPFDTKCKEHPINPICLFCVDDNSKKFYFYF